MQLRTHNVQVPHLRSPVARLGEMEYSGVTQGSVLRPILCIIYINDTDLGLNNFISKFADDMKICNVVLLQCGRQSLQECLHKISDWSVKQEMLFHLNRCQILQVGSRNIKQDDEMCGLKIKSVQSAKDHGVTGVSNLKLSQQCNESIK